MVVEVIVVRDGGEGGVRGRARARGRRRGPAAAAAGGIALFHASE